MAQHTVIECAGGTWTELSNATVTSITFQNLGPDDVFIGVTTSTSPPSNTGGAIVYKAFQGESNISLSDLAPGLSGTRIWAKPVQGRLVNVSISHG